MGLTTSIGFALTLLLLAGVPPAAGQSFPGHALDSDANGLEDDLDRYLAGQLSFASLRSSATAAADRARARAGDLAEHPAPPGEKSAMAPTVRLLVFGSTGDAEDAAVRAAGAGLCRVQRRLESFGGITVIETDAVGLRALLAAPPAGRVVLDREGVPALAESRALVGAAALEGVDWNLGDDWASSIAILDSGCDTAHGDLGDDDDDDIDGPPPAVGDAGDWYSSATGWPLFEGYKVIGWHDVTDDFPAAAGPWDYHHHGTALASVAAGAGNVDPALRGMAPAARLTVVKFYDFDGVWRAWAGDFLAACAWVLENRDRHRIGPVLMAVNWEEDLGIDAAMAALTAAGMSPVAAVGNDGPDAGFPGWPAGSREVLTVGAVNDAGAVAAYSSRGHPDGPKPDLLAPGGGLDPAEGRILCADIEPDDSYSGRYGTSLAAAHVAGLLYLLDEALHENGVVLERDAAAVRLRRGLLRATAAPVTLAESTGGGTYGLDPEVRRDHVRGWGLVRIDAAVDACLTPLLPGRAQSDTLSADWKRPVLARRLGLQPGVRYLIEAVPSLGLDVALEVVDPQELGDDPLHAAVDAADANGPGVSEFLYTTAGETGWRALVVRRLAGEGAVTLRVREAASFAQQGTALALPGRLTGGPAVGSPGTGNGPSFVIPSRVAVDQQARSLLVIDPLGQARAGWPSFVFPAPSAQGGLTRPLVWDLDGAAGDEIVVASDFGSVYFFDAFGDYLTVDLTLNRSLTAPVGLELPGGERRVCVLDRQGGARVWRHGAVEVAARDLGHDFPLAPAAGILTGTEALVVAFPDGMVFALDGDLNDLPGWPVDLGADLIHPPVLCDLDEDGRHEVVQPVLDVQGTLQLRILDGAGLATGLDGTVLPAPGGGDWIAVAPPIVTGRYGDGGARITAAGLGTNAGTGAEAAWLTGFSFCDQNGSRSVEVAPGLRVGATTDEGDLVVDGLVLPAPVAWNARGDWGTDPMLLVHLRWSELLYGLTSIPGAATLWADGGNDPAASRQPVLRGGSPASAIGAMGAALADLGDGVLVRLEVVDGIAGLVPLLGGYGEAPVWSSARADGRNSGAYPLRRIVAAAPAPVASGPLKVHPNPGAGRFRFRLAGAPAGTGVEVFDLRGRRVRRLVLDAAGGIGWDGRDDGGRRLPAGTYLARVRGAAQSGVTRVTIAR